jgi:hypothetical protein
VKKIDSKESIAIRESSKNSTESSSQEHSGAGRLHKGQSGRIHVCKGILRLPFPRSNTYLLEV